MTRIVTALVLIIFSTATQAQTPDVIDEVVVTTTRSEALRILNAGNIAVVDTAEIANDFPADLLNRAPGVHIHRGSGQEHLTSIRSPVLVGGAGAGSFLYLEDGIAMRAPGFANINGLMDALPEHSDRVEITRGPGSALYGSNALHGLVNFISRPLDTEETRIDFRGGSYGRHQLAASHAGRAGNLAYRNSITLAGETEGYRDEQNYGRQAVRLQTAWSTNHAHYRATLSGVNLNQETAGYVSSYKDASIAEGNTNPDAHRDMQNIRGHLRIDRSLNNGATLSLTPYFRSNEMAFRMHFLPTTPLEENSHQSFGALLSYAQTGDVFSYIVGLDADSTSGALTETQTAPRDQFFNYLTGTHYDYTVSATTLAPFIHTVIAPSDALRFTFGLRHEATSYDYDNRTDNGRQGRLYRPADTSLDFADTSPKLGMTYRLPSDYVVFVNLARAARAPQTTDLFRLRDADKSGPLEPNPATIDSETLDSFELGYRGGSESLSFEIAYYSMAKNNYHFRDGNDYYIANGKTTHEGIELDFLWQIASSLTLGGNYTQATHRYDFANEVSGRNQESETIVKGNAIDSAPETLARLQLNWLPTARFDIALQASHIGAYFMDASNTSEYEGHNLVDLRFAYQATPSLALDLHIANLTDEVYAARADKWFRGNERFFPGEPRSFMLGVKARF